MIVDRFTGETYEILDFHAHLGTWPNFSQVYPDVAALQRAMDCCGIDRIVASHTLTLTGEFSRGNEQTEKISTAFPRVLGYVGVNPHYEKESLAQLDRYLGKGCFCGIKLHPETHQYRIADECCQSIFRRAAQVRCPVLIHVMSEQCVRDCEKIAAQFPEVPLIMGHSGGVAYRELAVKTCCDAPNVYFDLTASVMEEGCVEWMVETAGADRVVFGSDVPFVDPKHSVGQVLYSRLSAADKRKIFSENAKRILSGVRF